MLEISQNFQENACVRVPLKLQVSDLQLYLKSDFGTSCEFYEISKNTFFTEHLWATAYTKYVNSIIASLIASSFYVLSPEGMDSLGIWFAFRKIIDWKIEEHLCI